VREFIRVIPHNWCLFRPAAFYLSLWSEASLASFNLILVGAERASKQAELLKHGKETVPSA
jgi:hypothetical protein